MQSAFHIHLQAHSIAIGSSAAVAEIDGDGIDTPSYRLSLSLSYFPFPCRSAHTSFDTLRPSERKKLEMQRRSVFAFAFLFDRYQRFKFDPLVTRTCTILSTPDFQWCVCVCGVREWLARENESSKYNYDYVRWRSITHLKIFLEKHRRRRELAMQTKQRRIVSLSKFVHLCVRDIDCKWVSLLWHMAILLLFMFSAACICVSHFLTRYLAFSFAANWLLCTNWKRLCRHRMWFSR